MHVFHPDTGRLVAARNRLLQQALRAEPLPFPIEAEYPLVLGAERAAFSYCLRDGDVIVAHANLWPRSLVMDGGREIAVGLVGNVATDAARRGQGIMSGLLDELRQEAARRGLKALVLWSDLLEFYQKQGFASFGQERRFAFSLKRLRKLGLSGAAFGPLGNATTDDAEALLRARFPVAGTLRRSAEEFKELLAIPAVTALARRGAAGLDAYALTGKGADMVGVVHEWGAPTVEALLQGVLATCEATGLDEILLLAPAALPQAWYRALRGQAESVTAHPVGLAWTADAETKAALEAAFIWGLDSI